MEKVKRGLFALLILFSIYASVVVTNVAASSAPEIEWEKVFDKNDSYDIRQTVEGGYIVAGEAYLLKVDSKGNEEWSKNIKMESELYDEGHAMLTSVQQTKDGGYILAAKVVVPRSYYTYLLKVDSDGNEEWSRHFSIYSLFPPQVLQTRDNEYILLTDISIIKTDANGNTVWIKEFGPDYSAAGIQETDNGYIIFGPELLKVDSKGNKVWTAGYDIGEKSWDLSVEDFCRTPDGGYMVLGHTWYLSDEKINELVLLKYSVDGDQEWYKQINSKTIGEASSIYIPVTIRGYGKEYNFGYFGRIAPKVKGYSIYPTKDGGYIINGIVGPRTANMILKTDTNGNLEWSKIIAERICSDSSSSIEQTNDGGYIVLSFTKHPEYLTADKPVIIKLAPEQKSESEPTPTPTTSAEELPEVVQCVKYYNYEGERKYADDFKHGHSIELHFKNNTKIPWDDKYKEGVFDCSEMSAMYEWYFENQGYPAKIRGIDEKGKENDHCWVIIERSDGTWMALEPLTQMIFDPENKDYHKSNYYKKFNYEFETIREAQEEEKRQHVTEDEFDWWNNFDEYRDTKWCSEPPNPIEVPGFEAVFAIAGLSAVAYLLRRKGR